jgi:hypothetical protein
LPSEAVDIIDFGFLIRVATPNPVRRNGYADVDQTTLYDEEFEEPIVAEDEPSDHVLAILTRQDAVNRRRTCAFHYDCTLHPRESLFYCTQHHRVYAKYRPYIERTNLAFIRAPMLLPEPQLSIAFQSPQSGHHKQALQLLRDIDKNVVVCLVDVEFGTVRGFNAIPYQISIRNGLSGEIVLSTFVDYSSRESTDIEDGIAQIPPPQL